MGSQWFPLSPRAWVADAHCSQELLPRHVEIIKQIDLEFIAMAPLGGCV